MIVEVVAFKQLTKDGIDNIPQHIKDYCNERREMLRVFRENVMLAVRDYNLVLDAMSDYEKELFSEHLTLLEVQKNRGIKTLRWSSTVDSFVKKCRSHCKDVY